MMSEPIGRPLGAALPPLALPAAPKGSGRLRGAGMPFGAPIRAGRTTAVPRGFSMDQPPMAALNSVQTRSYSESASPTSSIHCSPVMTSALG